MVTGMTYRVEQFVARITSPVVVYFGDEILELKNGQELAERSFDRSVAISEIRASDSAVVITLVENDRVNDINWCGEEPVGFF